MAKQKVVKKARFLEGNGNSHFLCIFLDCLLYIRYTYSMLCFQIKEN